MTEVENEGTHETQELRQSVLDHLWMHNKGWSELAENGGPLIASTGSGLRVVDSDGKSWMDVNGGYMSVNVGYGRSEIADAVYEQMTALTYFPNGTATKSVARLAAKLAEITPGDLSRCFFVSGGSEANETSVKVARAYYRRVGHAGRYKVISRRYSYHGALGMSMWLGGVPSGNTRVDYEPAYPGMVYVPQPYPYRCELGGTNPDECAELCARALENQILFSGPDSVAAFIAEPIAVPPPVAVPGQSYWPRVREICDKYGVILIADEVITGFGRTGRMFGIDHWGVNPDVMSIAKGIVSSYLPLGATIASESIAGAFSGVEGSRFFQHVLTNSGHPVAAAASLRNIEIIEEEGLVENSAYMGGYFLERLIELQDKHRIIGNVSGLGLLLGVDLVKDRETREVFPVDAGLSDILTDEFEKRGLILRAGFSSISFGPPLCINRDEINEIVEATDEVIGEVSKRLAIG